MKIYSEEPKDWKDLQKLTAKFLTEIEYNCEIEKDVDSVRGNVNIDVYAENIKKVPNSIILCECKYWTSSIPQTVIHSFRTVVTDIGANYGFIIAKSGFQKGSFTVATNTNIKLLTWSEFLEYFKENWIKSMTSKVNILNHNLLTYVGAGFPIFFKKEYQKLTTKEIEKFEILNRKYFNTAFYSMVHDYKNLDTKEFDIKYFDLHILTAEKEYGRKFASYDDFYLFLIDNAKQGIKEFDELFKAELRKTNYS